MQMGVARRHQKLVVIPNFESVHDIFKNTIFQT